MQARGEAFAFAVMTILVALLATVGLGCTSDFGQNDDDNEAVGSSASALKTVVAPTFDPPSGTYPEKIKVKLETTTNNATIHYTLDGSDPTTASPIYDGKIKVNITTTIKAFAVKPNFNPSAIVSASYEIGTEHVAPVVATPPSGVYGSPVVVALSTQTTKATIHYTLDGSEPTTASPVYSAGAPIEVSANTTIRAFAVRKKWLSSQPTQHVYAFQAQPVLFTPPGGSYNQPIAAILATQTPGATIYYTVDGSVPTPQTGLVYGGPIALATTTTINAIAVKPGFEQSQVSFAQYVISIPPSNVAPVSFNPPSGQYLNPIVVGLATPTPGATIHYTLDNTDPTTSSPIYSAGAPIEVTTGTTFIRAFAVKDGSLPSEITQAVYVVTPKVGPVFFNPPSGTYANPISVALVTQTPNATIFYSVDGSVPSTSSLVYAGPIVVAMDLTIRAIAFAPGLVPSDETQATYVIVPQPSQVAPVFFTPASGQYSNPINVVLVTPTPGATLLYTVDGSEPTVFNSLVYGGPIFVSTNTTIKAFATKTGSIPSDVTTAVYVIQP